MIMSKTGDDINKTKSKFKNDYEIILNATGSHEHAMKEAVKYKGNR